MKHQGIGARLLRKEDDRYLRGRGQYVGDIQLAGHAGGGVPAQPAGARAHQGRSASRPIRERVLIAEDLAGVASIRADTTLPGFKSSRSRSWPRPRCATSASWWRCASRRPAPKPRTSSPRSRSISRSCPRSSTCWRRASPAPRWCTSTGATTSSSNHLVDDDLRGVKAKAAVSVTRASAPRARSCRRSKGRGVVPTGTRGSGQLVVHSSTQKPHIVRSGLAECLGLDEGQIRVIAPDVGGGFGYKGILLPEEVALAWATRKLGRPVRWIEDRREQPHRQRQLPRAPLRHHRLRRRRRPAAGARLRGHRRFGRLLVLSVLGLPGGGAGGLDPARPLRHGRTTAAAPSRSPPTSRRSCPTAASPAPACASRWR